MDTVTTYRDENRVSPNIRIFEGDVYLEFCRVCDMSKDAVPAVKGTVAVYASANGADAYVERTGCYAHVKDYSHGSSTLTHHDILWEAVEVARAASSRVDSTE